MSRVLALVLVLVATACGGRASTESTTPVAAAAPPSTAAPVAGGLTASQIREVIAANIGDVQVCYERGLSRNPALAGRVTVAFIIAPSGRVADCTVAQATLPDEAVALCIADKVRGWRFPEPDPPGPVSVRFPFNLSTETR